MEVKMQKLFITLFTQLLFLTSLHATESAKMVKSDLLRAIHHNDSNEVRAIVATQKSVITADPILERMVDAYFLDEQQALEELKEKARQKREDEARELAAAIAAKEAEDARLKAVEKENREKEAEALVAEQAAVAKPVVKERPKPAAVKPVKKKVSPHKRKVVATSKSVVTKPVAPKPVKVTNQKIRMSKVDIAGKWKAAKNKKDVTFKAYDDNTFVLEERSDSGTLRLDGTYRQNGEQLLLDIQKITYNVRSREAAVQRIYHLKAVSSKRLILLDEKGEVAYSFSR